MAPKFLLGADISPEVAAGCRSKGLDVKAVCEVMDVESPDESVLRYAIKEGRILVTYNNEDFAPLLGDLIREGVPVPGVVLVSGRTIASSDFEGLVRAIRKLAEAIGKGEADPTGGLFLHR